MKASRRQARGATTGPCGSASSTAMADARLWRKSFGIVLLDPRTREHRDSAVQCADSFHFQVLITHIGSDFLEEFQRISNVRWFYRNSAIQCADSFRFQVHTHIGSCEVIS